MKRTSFQYSRLLCVFYLVLFCTVLTVSCLSAEIRGRVNSEPNATGIQGVVVTDGLNVVRTNEKGDFILPGHKQCRFVSITTPSGYQSLSPFALSLTEKSDGYDFTLKHLEKQTGRFIHIADTETSEYGRWIDDLKEFVQNDTVDFIIHTGDICYEPGMKFHAEHITTQTMGTPVHYALGNHDLLAGKYGEERFEQLFGPVWYSFDVAGVHYVVLPMLSGDHRPSYTKQDVLAWLRNDLSVKPKERPFVIFCHDLWFAVPGNRFATDTEDGELDLEKLGLKAWVYGHWHDHFHKEMRPGGVKTFCSAQPDKGAIDHSLASFRLFEIDGNGKIQCETRYLSLHNHLVPLAYEENGLWSVSANGYDSRTLVKNAELKYGNDSIPMIQKSPWNWHGNVPKLFDAQKALKVSVEYENGSVNVRNVTKNPRITWCTNLGACSFLTAPVVEEDKVFMALIDDDASQKCGIVAIETQTGKESWRFSTGNSVKNAIAATQGTVLACDVEGELYAIDAKTGKLRWHRKLHSHLLSPYQNGVAVQDGIVYAGCGSGFSAWNISDGSAVWKSACIHAEPTCARHLLAGDVLVTGAFWRGREGFERKSGKKLWTLNDNDTRFCNATPAYHEGELFYAGTTKLNRIDPKTGQMLQSTTSPVSLESASRPLVTDRYIIVGTGDSGVIAFDKKSFEKVWQFQTNPALAYSVPYKKNRVQSVEAGVIKSGDRLYFGGCDGYFYCLEHENGTLHWKINLGAPILAKAEIENDSAYVVDFGGTLYRINVKQ